MPHHPPSKEELAKIVEKITDRATLDRVESVIKEPELKRAINELSKDRACLLNTSPSPRD